MVKYIFSKEIDHKTVDIAIRKKRRVKQTYESKHTGIKINVEYNVPNGYVEYYIENKDADFYSDDYKIDGEIIEFEDLEKEYPAIRKQIIAKYRKFLKNRK